MLIIHKATDVPVGVAITMQDNPNDGFDVMEIIKPTLGFVFGVLTLGSKYLFDWWRDRKPKTEIHDTQTSFGLLKLQATIFSDVEDLLEDSGADRALGLTAYGKESFETIEIWLSHNSSPSNVNQTQLYDKIKSDSAYQEILARLENDTSIILRTEDLKGIIRDYYVLEGVVQSIWGAFKIVKESGHNEIVYMSISTHKTEGFTDNDITHIKTFFSRNQVRFEDVV